MFKDYQSPNKVGATATLRKGPKGASMNTIEPSSTDIASLPVATAKHAASSHALGGRLGGPKSPTARPPKGRSGSFSENNYGLAAELTNQSRIMQSDGNQGKVLSTVSLPSLGGRRRVHNDGLLMLDNNYNLKETEQKFAVMENRLKRLQEEEARAERNQRAAERKAQQMLEARSRHYQELLGKISHYEEK
jgi:hypothetical protein